MLRFSVADHIFELAMGALCRPVPCPRNFRPFVTTEEGEPLEAAYVGEEYPLGDI